MAQQQGSTRSTAAGLKEDGPGFCFDNYARNAGLPLDKKMHMPTVCLSLLSWRVGLCVFASVYACAWCWAIWPCPAH